MFQKLHNSLKSISILPFSFRIIPTLFSLSFRMNLSLPIPSTEIAHLDFTSRLRLYYFRCGAVTPCKTDPGSVSRAGIGSIFR